MYIKRIISSMIAVVTITTLLPIQVSYALEEIVSDEPAVKEIIFNKESDEYKEISGIFQDDLVSKCPYGKTTRNCYSRYGKLGYEFTVEESGNYKIEYWNPFSTNSWSQRNQQLFTITTNGMVSEVKLNLKFVGGWKDLGIYTINAGETASVILSREIKDGGIRSGALRLTKTTENAYVQESDEPVLIERHYPDGNGVLITNSYKSNQYKIEENGSFGGIALHNAIGRATKYSYTDNASVKYRVTVPEMVQREYHAMCYILSFPDEGDTRANSEQKLIVRHRGAETEFTIDNTKTEGWVYLGKYTFTGEENYIELFNGVKDINGKSKMLLIGGAYFVSPEDADFNPDKYPAISPVSTMAKQGGN